MSSNGREVTAPLFAPAFGNEGSESRFMTELLDDNDMGDNNAEGDDGEGDSDEEGDNMSNSGDSSTTICPSILLTCFIVYLFFTFSQM